MVPLRDFQNLFQQAILQKLAPSRILNHTAPCPEWGEPVLSGKTNKYESPNSILMLLNIQFFLIFLWHFLRDSAAPAYILCPGREECIWFEKIYCSCLQLKIHNENYYLLIFHFYFMYRFFFWIFLCFYLHYKLLKANSKYFIGTTQDSLNNLQFFSTIYFFNYRFLFLYRFCFASFPLFKVTHLCQYIELWVLRVNGSLQL